MFALMNTLLGVLFIVLLYAGIFPYWVFVFAAIAYGYIRKRESEQSGQDRIVSMALLIGIITSITSLSYAVHVEGSETALCVFCGSPASTHRGLPLPWFGLGGGDTIFAPFFLGLDILAWFLIALLFLDIARFIDRRAYRQSRMALLTASILVILLPFLFSTVLEAINKKKEMVQQQELDARVWQGMDIVKHSIQFEKCQDSLIPSSKVAGTYDLLVQVTVYVNLSNEYSFSAGINDPGFLSPLSNTNHNWTVGEQELSFLFYALRRATGLSVLDGRTYVQGWEASDIKPGPYIISVHLDAIGNVNGQLFGLLEIQRAMQLRLIDQTRLSMACSTQSYKVEDFRLPRGVVPAP